MTVAPATPEILDSGEMIHRVEIQKKTETYDSGETTETWTTVTTWWARVYEGSGREFYHRQQMQADMTHLVKMQYYSAFDPANTSNPTDLYQLVWNDRVLGIIAIQNPDGQRIVHMVTCAEKVSGT